MKMQSIKKYLNQYRKFYAKKEFAGREVAIESLTRTPPKSLSRGLRLGYFRQIRKILDEELEKILMGEKGVQDALDNTVKLGNLLLRRFEKQNKGKILP